MRLDLVLACFSIAAYRPTRFLSSFVVESEISIIVQTPHWISYFEIQCHASESISGFFFIESIKFQFELHPQHSGKFVFLRKSRTRVPNSSYRRDSERN